MALLGRDVLQDPLLHILRARMLEWAQRAD